MYQLIVVKFIYLMQRNHIMASIPQEQNTQEDSTNDNPHRVPPKEDHHQSAIQNNPCQFATYRLIVVLIAIGITIAGQFIRFPTQQIDCIDDPGHYYTRWVNDHINSDHKLAQTLQIFSSLLIDSTFLITIVYWVLYTRNIRFFFALYCFYIVRFLHLQMIQFKFPNGYYWEENGLPSIINRYGWYSDFFFSGHVGFLTLNALEWRKIGKPWMFYLFMIASAYQAFVVISFRIHYTIDVPAGYIYAHWIYRLTCDYEVIVEKANKKLYEWLTQSCRKKLRYSEQIQDDQVHVKE